MPTMVAMARSGETFITRDDRHGLWLHLPSGAGRSGPIDDGAAARAVADHGFTLVDRDFPTWPALDDFRQEEAARFAPPLEIDPAELDGDDVAGMLDVARRWAAGGDGIRSRRLLMRLLRAPAAVANANLLGQILGALEALEQTSAITSLRPAPTDAGKLEARQRWSDLVTAA